MTRRRVIVPKFPNQFNCVLIVEDYGLGITKDYNGDIKVFMESKKGKSNKVKGRGIGHKGIGMLQYTGIGKTVLIVSQDNLNVYRIPMIKNEDGITGYGNWTAIPIRGITVEYRRELGVTHTGTKVYFFDPSPGRETIDVKKLEERLRLRYGVAIARYSKMAINVNAKQLTPPEYLLGHERRERLLLTLEGGKEIRGAIWDDEEGIGSVMIHVNGEHVEDHQFSPRRCTGWFDDVDGALDVDSGRHNVLKQGKAWNECKEKIVSECMARFPTIKEETERSDKDYVKQINEVLLRAIAPILPLMPSVAGQQQKRKKVKTKGDVQGDDEPGHEFHTPTKKLTGTGGTHSITSRIGNVGPEDVIRYSDDEDKRQQQGSLNTKAAHCGRGKPLLALSTEQVPYSLLVNKDSPLFRYCFSRTWRASPTEKIRRLAPYLAANVWLVVTQPDLDTPQYRQMTQLLENTTVNILQRGGLL
jgi:hypothetical protein